MEGLLEALSYISPDDYETWYQVGMALKYEGCGVEVWDSWSRGSAKYRPGECARKWETFRRDDNPKTGATIFQLAKEGGYSPSGAMDWDDFFGDEVPEFAKKPVPVVKAGKDFKIIDHEIVKEKQIPEAAREPIEDLKRYLSLLFLESDFVGYCDRLDLVEGRYVPKNGLYKRTAGSILNDLKRGMEYACIKPESEGGAMIRFNPLDGEGEKDANVTDFRYCLVESDSDSVEKQYALYLAMQLPIICLVFSGGKSLHAIVRIDAGKDHSLYKKRVDFVYEFCEKNGLHVDKNDKNASRYSRMPGIKRGDKMQYIVAENIGFDSYEKWDEWTKVQNDNLPKDVSLAEIFQDLKPLKPELIQGVLRVEHKMLIAAPSKAGKSFLLMYLAVCFAEGMEWLGHRCQQGKVFYVNLELDEDSCNHRFRDIYDKLNIQNPHFENIQVWHLRGKSQPMNILEPFLENRVKEKNYLAVIIDPIYKVITGDENNATEMSQFCAYFDKLATNADVALVYSHHHSKGATSKYSSAVDRSSGSGVFARDPDAILDLTELDPNDAVEKYKEYVNKNSSSLTAWELTGTLREFPPFEPVRLWFDYPVHRVDDQNFLAEAKYSGRGRQGVGRDQRAKEDIAQDIEDYFDSFTFEVNQVVDAETLKDELGLSDANLKKHTGTKTNFEKAKIGDREYVFRRGLDIIQVGKTSYQKKKVGSTSKWVQI